MLGRLEHATGGGGAAQSVDEIADSLNLDNSAFCHDAHISTNRHEKASGQLPVNNRRSDAIQPWAMTDGGETNNDIGARLALLRVWAGFDSQTGFAASIGVDPSEINNYENGRRRLALTTAQRLRTRFRVTLDWLYYGDRSGLSVEIDRVLPRLSDMLPIPTPRRGRRKKPKDE